VKEDAALSTCPMDIGKIVGAGKNADIDQNVDMVMGCMPTTKTDLVFAGADNANVNGHVNLTITSGTFGKVFGGNNLGGGKFKISGSIIGAYVIQMLTITLYAMKVSSTDVKAYKAIVIIILVVIGSPVVKSKFSKFMGQIRSKKIEASEKGAAKA
jgi:ABC-type xylose transport system permease subunit